MTRAIPKLLRKLAGCGALVAPLVAQTAQVQKPQDKLHVYFVDVEGGYATLFVPDHGESPLIDTGWPDRDDRDAKRVAAVVKMAGRSRIDNVLITQYHDDHVGGVPQLVRQVPVARFFDHGPNRELDHGITEKGEAAYQRTLVSSGASHTVAKAGDHLAILGMRVLVVSANGNVLHKPAPGAGRRIHPAPHPRFALPIRQRTRVPSAC